MNRKLLFVVAALAVLALLGGAAVGRSLLSQETPTPAKGADIIRFKDEISKVSIAYPATWRKLADRPSEPDRALAVSPGGLDMLVMRVANPGLEPVTREGLPIVRKFTDGLLAEDPRIRQRVAPQAVIVGGLPGWRYQYNFGTGDASGTHDHYFLFKDRLMIQLVFQAVPAARFSELAPTFNAIAASFRGRET